MRLATFAIAALAGLSPRPGNAEPCRVQAAASDAEVQARLRFIQSAFENREPAMRLWVGSFAAGHTVMAGGAAALAVNQRQDSGARGELWVGAFGSTLALISLLIAHPPLVGATDALSALPDHEPETRQRKLAFAERRLKSSAKAARFARSWLTRSLSMLYSVGSATFVWLAFDRPEGGLRQLLGGLVIGQGRIILYPGGIAEDWSQYLAQWSDCGGRSSTADIVGSAPDWYVGPSSGGLSIGLRF